MYSYLGIVYLYLQPYSVPYIESLLLFKFKETESYNLTTFVGSLIILESTDGSINI